MTLQKAIEYIKKYRIILMLCTLIGATAAGWYANSKQEYNASMTLLYTDPLAENGQNPDGSALNIEEIRSANTVEQALRNADLSGTSESVRARIRILPVIPDIEAEKEVSAAKNGEPYYYFPTEYQISFTASKEEGSEYAIDVLEAVVGTYIDSYSARYVEKSLFPDNAIAVENGTYDYLESVDILTENANRMLNCLSSYQEGTYGYYGTKSGYSINDLIREYEYLRDNRLIPLEAKIREQKLTKNKTMLLTKQQNQKANLNLSISSLEENVERLKPVIDEFASKTLAIDGGVQKGTQEDWTEILSEVVGRDMKNGDEEGSNPAKTTYDRLVTKYASLKENQISAKTRLGKCEELITLFGGELLRDEANLIASAQKEDNISEEDGNISAENTENSPKEPLNIPEQNLDPNVDEEIKKIASEFTDLYQKAASTISSVNKQYWGNYFTIKSSTHITEAITVLPYIILGGILCLMIGIISTVVFGRLNELFTEYRSMSGV